MKIERPCVHSEKTRGGTSLASQSEGEHFQRERSRLLLFLARDVSLCASKLLQQFFDCGFKLTIAAGKIIFRRIVYSNVRLHTVVFHVRMFWVGEIDADARRAHRRRVDQRVT